MTIDRKARQNKVLEAVVKYHTESALPVSSSQIARELGLSSATIRNVMFELEKEGYLKQPYTSAGRIPTDLGYRRYVDNMRYSARRFSYRNISSKIKQFISRKKFFEEVIEGVSSAISQITRYTGLALSPNNKLYFGGTYHMLEQPEFSELEAVRDFLKVLEEKNELVQIMNQDLETKGTTVHIGRENIFDELKECTIITSTYRFRKRVCGNIGVIGPMRMSYEKIVPLVETLAEMTTEVLEEI